MMVKICGITNFKMQWRRRGGASRWLQLLPQEPGYIAPDCAAGMIAKLPAHVWKVGVFVNESQTDNRTRKSRRPRYRATVDRRFACPIYELANSQ